MSIIPGFDDLVLIRLTDEDLRIIETHGCPDDEYLGAVAKAKRTDDGVLLGCRRECLIDVNCVLFAVSEELADEEELSKLVQTYEKLEPYEFG